MAPVTVLGVEIDGARGTISLCIDRHYRIVRAAAALLAQPLVSARELARVSLPGDSSRGAASQPVSHLAASSSSPSLRRSSSAYIRLAVTKTGSNQTAEISNVDVITLLQRHISRRPADGRLFSFPSASAFSSTGCTKDGAVVVGRRGNLYCARHRFVPLHSPLPSSRRCHAPGQQTIEHVLHRGRWQSNSSARTYLQTGAAALISCPSKPCSGCPDCSHSGCLTCCTTASTASTPHHPKCSVVATHYCLPIRFVLPLSLPLFPSFSHIIAVLVPPSLLSSLPRSSLHSSQHHSLQGSGVEQLSQSVCRLLPPPPSTNSQGRCMPSSFLVLRTHTVDRIYSSITQHRQPNDRDDSERE